MPGSRSRAPAADTGRSSSAPARARSGSRRSRSREIDPAAVPTTPVFPRTKLTLLVAAVLGLGLGIGAALLRESFSTSVETAEDLARATGLPVYAEVPAEVAVLKIHDPDALLENKRLRVVAESLRDLRTNLLFSDDSLRSLVVTSPDGSHGKTTISFGLAVTLARAGTRTLLVDGDLRRGPRRRAARDPRRAGPDGGAARGGRPARRRSGTRASTRSTSSPPAAARATRVSC